MIDEYLQLGIGPAASIVTAVAVSKWGQEGTVSCLYASEQPYQLVFYDCTQIQWDFHGEEGIETDANLLLGIVLGEQGHVKAAVITADLFELSILYGTYELRMDHLTMGESKWTNEERIQMALMPITRWYWANPPLLFVYMPPAVFQNTYRM
jgi:hypothetical protein